MHNPYFSGPDRILRVMCAALGLVAVGFVLSACGITDEAGTKFQIVMESFSGDDESLAPLGILQVGEMASFRFEVTRSGGDPVDRTGDASFALEKRSNGDEPDHFLVVWSSDPSATPHTIRSDVPDTNVTLCASYDGPEVLKEEPQEVCMRLATFVPET